MRVLVVGNGAREAALVWKIAQSPLVTRVYAAPGNAGMASQATCVPIAADDLPGLADFASTEQMDLTVVGPEIPLIAGIVETFQQRGLTIFGPSSGPARIEGSKAFAKELMVAEAIPTAAFFTCSSLAEARAHIQAHYAQQGPAARIVVKADGLAAGKGVVVAESEAEALAAADSMMGSRVFGASGDRVVLEECLEGPEASLMAITDGTTVVPLVPSQDHKRMGEGDTGPNTGGMGAYAPVPAPVLPPDVTEQAIERILKPAIRALGERGVPYRGVLYAGIIVTNDGPKCIEFNCRLGDPETQVILPLLQSDLVPLLLAACHGTLSTVPVQWRKDVAACVVAASGGYPGAYQNGKLIRGLASADSLPDTLVFHAGTAYAENGDIVTAGGRVLSVTGIGATLPEALARAYAGIDALHFDGMTVRRDIGQRALRP